MTTPDRLVGTLKSFSAAIIVATHNFDLRDSRLICWLLIMVLINTTAHTKTMWMKLLIIKIYLI